MTTQIVDNVELLKLNKTIATTGKKYDADVQVAVCSAFQHIMEHGDTTGMTDLFKSVRRGDRPTLKRFIGDYIQEVRGEMAIKQINQSTGQVVLRKGMTPEERATALNVAGMCEGDWTSKAETTEVKYATLAQILTQTAKKIAKTVENTDATEEDALAIFRGGLKSEIDSALKH